MPTRTHGRVVQFARQAREATTQRPYPHFLYPHTGGGRAHPTMSGSEEIPVGARVEIKHIQGARGIVRFSGQTQFQVGKWIGVELSEAKGRNDGTVQGVAYFRCKPNYGVFVKPSQVTIVKEPEPTPGPSVCTYSHLQ